MLCKINLLTSNRFYLYKYHTTYIQYFPYWLFLKDGWIEKDSEAINQLKIFLIKFFNIIPNIIIDESLDKSKENYGKKDNNFMSIPIKSGFEKYES